MGAIFFFKETSTIYRITAPVANNAELAKAANQRPPLVENNNNCMCSWIGELSLGSVL